MRSYYAHYVIIVRAQLNCSSCNIAGGEGGGGWWCHHHYWPVSTHAAIRELDNNRAAFSMSISVVLLSAASAASLYPHPSCARNFPTNTKSTPYSLLLRHVPAIVYLHAEAFFVLFCGVGTSHSNSNISCTIILHLFYTLVRRKNHEQAATKNAKITSDKQYVSNLFIRTPRFLHGLYE